MVSLYMTGWSFIFYQDIWEPVGEKASWLINSKIVTGYYLRLHGMQYDVVEREEWDQEG